jgi:hypothetical protein
MFVKLNRTCATQLQGPPDSVIPVEVIIKSFQTRVKTLKGKYISRTVRRRQFPIICNPNQIMVWFGSRLRAGPTGSEPDCGNFTSGELRIQHN